MKPIALFLMPLSLAFAGAALALEVSSNPGAGAAPAAEAQAAPLARARQNGARNDTPAALNLLEAKGFGAYSNFHAQGNDYVATVNQNGRQWDVTVDPDTGQLTNQT